MDRSRGEARRSRNPCYRGWPNCSPMWLSSWPCCCFSLALLVTQAVRRRRFYCAPSGLEVEVQFDERGLPGMRRPVGVLSCSAFEPPNAVRCSRRCLDEDVRRLWQSWPALPLRREP